MSVDTHIAFAADFCRCRLLINVELNVSFQSFCDCDEFEEYNYTIISSSTYVDATKF